MNVFAHILAQPLAPDHLWPVLVLLATLAVMAGLRTIGHRFGAWWKTRHRFRDLSAKHHTPWLHGHR